MWFAWTFEWCLNCKVKCWMLLFCKYSSNNDVTGKIYFVSATAKRSFNCLESSPIVVIIVSVV